MSWRPSKKKIPASHKIYDVTKQTQYYQLPIYKPNEKNNNTKFEELESCKISKNTPRDSEKSHVGNSSTIKISTSSDSGKN